MPPSLRKTWAAGWSGGWKAVPLAPGHGAARRPTEPAHSKASPLAPTRRRASIVAVMPELPDVVVYIECLERRVVGQTLERVRIASPFVLRTADPPISHADGKTVREIRRL